MMTENLLREVERTRSRFVALHYRYQQERNELQRLTAALRTIRGSDGKHPFGWPLPAITLWRFPRNPQGTRVMLPLPPLCGGDGKALDDSFRCVLRPLAAGAVCMVLDGELDLASADTFRMHINTASADGAKVFIFDLRGLTYLDSTGINAFLDMHRALSPSGRRLALVGPSRVVRRILGVLEVEQLIPIFDSLEDALTVLRAGEVS